MSFDGNRRAAFQTYRRTTQDVIASQDLGDFSCCNCRSKGHTRVIINNRLKRPKNVSLSIACYWTAEFDPQWQGTWTSCNCSGKIVYTFNCIETPNISYRERKRRRLLFRRWFASHFDLTYSESIA